MTPTVDPHVFIEEQSAGYVRYQDRKTRRRWEVLGVCDKRGDCIIGATVNGTYIADRAQLAAMSTEELTQALDVPTGPNYTGGCCPFTINVLEPMA